MGGLDSMIVVGGTAMAMVDAEVCSPFFSFA
jgi:hypothetical protein